MSLPVRVTIREVGPREGFQIHSVVVPTEVKLQLIDALASTGVPEIEVASFVNPKRVPQMADAEELCEALTPKEGVRYTGLYLNGRGFERAEACANLQNDCWIHLSASETFLKKNNRITIEESIAGLPAWLELFTKHSKALHGLLIMACFGCNDEGDVPDRKVLDLLSAMVDCGVKNGQPLKEVCLGDTMGWSTGERVKALVGAIKEKYPELTVSLHLHNTRGHGLEGVRAGLKEGVSVFDGSVAGLGGCPFTEGASGNVATEEILALCEEQGIETGINYQQYLEVASLAREIVESTL